MGGQSSRPDNSAPTALVQGLEDLQRGVEFQLRLICLGQAAVEPLGKFLLGPPALHPQPRMLAAEALGAIGGAAATRALITALVAGDLAALPLVYRLSEEAVRNRVARELARIGDGSAVEPLLEALARFHLVEAGAALRAFDEARAVPLLVDCLGDDFLRERAAGILFEFGEAAVDGLIAGLERDADVEPPWRVAGRATCARLLGEIGDPGAAAPLRARLADRRRPVRLAAAVALAHLLGQHAGDDVVARLIEGLEADDARAADDCSDALLLVGAATAPALVVAFTHAAELEEQRGERTPGPAVRALARTLGRMDEGGPEALAALVDHPRCFVRALAIANIGRSDPERARAIISRALRDPDPRVRRTAAGRLRQLGARCHA
jgi:HEAT repeat protein